jgi:hypothetical protein
MQLLLSDAESRFDSKTWLQYKITAPGILSSRNTSTFSVPDEHTVDSSAKNLIMNSSVAWKVASQDGFDGLILDEGLAIPDGLGDYECLISIEAASLNYRDITIAMVRSPFKHWQR